MVLAVMTRRSKWLDALSLAIVISIAIPFMLWLAVPSSVFMKPQAIVYDGIYVTSKRLTPFGAVLTEWNIEMAVNIDGKLLECPAPERHELVQPVESDTVTWEVGRWAYKCLRANPPIIATHTWRVLLFGIIPLRPVQLVATIERSWVPGQPLDHPNHPEGLEHEVR